MTFYITCIIIFPTNKRTGGFLMNKLLVTLCISGLAVPLIAAPPHHPKRPAPPPPPRPVVKPVPPPPPPVVVKPLPPPPPPPPRVVVVPQYSYSWYYGYWVPCYQGWYYYNGAWCWGGPGVAPAPPPWKPDFRRPAPPRPRSGPPKHGIGAPRPHHHHAPAKPQPKRR